MRIFLGAYPLGQLITKSETGVQRYINKMTINPNYDKKAGKASIEKELDKILNDMSGKLDKLSKSNPKVESDPFGLSKGTPGAKLDQNKPDLDLVLGDFNRALGAVGSVGTFGAAKYSRSGWLEVPNGIARYSSALLRHYFSNKYEKVDKDSNLLHLSHLAWNALAILELTLRQEEKNEKNIKTPFGKPTEGYSKQG